MVTYEATATVSDPTGNLLFYTNSVNVWNRNHQLMPNGQNLGGHESASQGAVIVRNPANPAKYYLFVVDGCDNQLVGGLKYSVIDMTQEGGLGGVTAKATQLSTISVTEKLTAVRHANGKDTWVIVHGWQTNNFYAYLVSASGIASTPVVTAIGSVHSGGGGSFGNANAVGYMKASPAGNKLALAKRDSNFELFDFNNATGQLSNYIPLSQSYRSYGVEFSPDGSRLYGTTLDGNDIYQFNLLAGSASAIAASFTLVGSSPSFTAYAGALQLASDGKIYVALYNNTRLGVINNPNTLGLNCNYSNSGPALGGRLSQLGLPNFPNAFAPLANEWTGAVSTVYTDAANWSAGYVPGSTDDVTIKATATRMPVLSTSAAAHTFTVEAGASMTVNGTFQLSGDLVNQGTFEGAGELQIGQAGPHSIGGRLLSVRSLTLATGATTTLTGPVQIRGILTLNDNLVTNGNTLTLVSDAAGTAMVVNNGNAVVSGSVTVQRYIAPGLNGGLGYRHYSAPVSNATFADLVTGTFSPVFNTAYNSAANPALVTPFPTVYGYEQQRLVTAATPSNTGFNAGWYSPAAATERMLPGTGYTVNLDAASVVDFVGTLNNGPITRGGLTRNQEPDGGWHLLGNPYPAPIDWRQMVANTTSLLNSVYVFKSSGQYDGSYASYVNGVGDARYIAAGQGFFVRVSDPSATGSLDFTNSARLTTYLSPDFNRPAAPETRPLVQLDLVSGTRRDAAYVYFEQGATAGFDAAYDAYKITTGEVPALAVQTGGEPLSISGLPNTLTAGPVTVPLFLSAPKAGSYTITAAQLLNLPAGVAAYLRDAQTGAVTNLQQASYTFSTSAPLQTATRFALVFSAQQVLATSSAQLSAQLTLYPNPAQGEVIVTLPASLRQPGSVWSLVNTLGQTVLQQAVPAPNQQGAVHLALTGIAQGVYSLRISGPAGVASQKLVVK
ncbi:T9SS type A sorting domain-containing protein [Hymenobacter metallicola]|nr:T9SS type A sorting domain-containing protein [Hymenobacter metallicola]